MKIHHQWLPDQIYYEANKFDPRLKAALEDMGHTFKEREYLGRLMGIMIDEETGQFVGYSDSSSPDGGAVGY
jgi:gamma-glutamyltranspeptidase/glutathione hydrolase